MFGFQVPRNHAQATAIDQENKNTKWADSEKAEKDQLVEYEIFDDRGHRSMAITPLGYKKIIIRFVYAVLNMMADTRAERCYYTSLRLY